MDLAEVIELVTAVAVVEPCCPDRAEVTAAAAASSRLRAWLDGRDVALASCLARLAPDATQALAEAARVSARSAGRVLERGRTVAELPRLAGALDAGTIGGDHVDVLGNALRRLDPPQRRLLAADADRLVELAERTTSAELRRALDAEVHQLQGAAGIDRLARQRRACRLRRWIDDDGMWRLHGQFDPETGVGLDGRLRAMVDTLYADGIPACAPVDPLERQAFLRAHALVALTRGAGTCGAPEVVVVVDTTAPVGPVVDWGLPVDLPAEVLYRSFEVADVACVVVRNGVVLHAPGLLDLGRATRLANRAQRRALRALYPTCAIDGCDTRFDLCKIHHVNWWRHGGRTDLDNLLPICVRHHHAVHEGGWQLDLDPDRTLTITYPDGARRVTRPPLRR